MTNQVFLIPGTHAWRDDGRVDWYHPDSAFSQALAAAGIQRADAGREFVWSTNLGGVGFGSEDLLVWVASGIQFKNHVECVMPVGRRIVATHSHGLQPALVAAARGLRIDLLVDVCGPVRGDVAKPGKPATDMMRYAELALPNIGRWVHFHAGKGDRMQAFGQAFDGVFDWRALLWRPRREHPLADENIGYKDADHGSLLRHPEQIKRVVQVIRSAA